MTIVRHKATQEGGRGGGQREDLGPVHKLLDCALEEDDPLTAIITFDDDMVARSSLDPEAYTLTLNPKP